MSILIRVVVIAMSAHAGSAFASIQFRDLPDPYQMAEK
jgi:hypothetical protein